MGRFLMLSGGGDGLGLALRLKWEGHEVATWIRERKSKRNYEGLLTKIDRNWETFLTPDTVVLFDSSGGGKTADRLRAQGYHVFTGSVFADQLELDRGTAFGLMQDAGIKVPHSETFNSFEKAREYVKKADKRLAFKPSGASADQLHSYLASDPEDMIEMLFLFEEIHKGKPEFELQDFVKGIEISSEGWFNGHRFMTPFNHTIERKQLMNEGLGPSGGCAGNVVWTCQESTPILEQGILRMASILREREYLGPIDLNAIVNDDGVWGLEFTPRFGYDAMPALLELFDANIGDTITAIAKREEPKTLPLKNLWAAALRVTIPPYPSEAFHPEEGVPIRGFTKDDRAHTYFTDVLLNERGRLVSSPAYGAIVSLTGNGYSITEALEGPYRLAERAKIPDKQYRTDLRSLFVNEYNKLEPYLKHKESPDAGLTAAAGV
jgi:phosphoribosylamine--glycine ligase